MSFNKDVISIKDLEIYAKHGVFPEENVLGQKFLICADLYCNTKAASAADDLNQSVNYGEVCHLIKDIMEGNVYNLIETIAEVLAQNILIKYPVVEAVEIEVKKPWAPVGLPVDTVSVKIKRQWHNAYIALGSNMGDKKNYLETAIKEINKNEVTSVTKVSEFIETKPYGGVEQDDFLNGVIEIKTMLDPEELLRFLNKIEADCDRERIVHWGPRTLDLDIIMYDDLVYDTERLQIPHVEMHKRDFVLGPMAEIAPWVRHPILKKTVKEMLEELES